MKKICRVLTVTALSLLAAMGMGAEAQPMTEADYSTGRVTVTDTVEKQKDITVKVKDSGGSTAFLGQVRSDYLGKYEVSFALNDIYGNYKVTVNDASAQKKNAEIYFDIFVPEFSAKAKENGKSIKYIEDLGSDALVVSLSLAHDPAHSSFEKLDTKLVCAAYDENMRLLQAEESEKILSEASGINSFDRSVEFSNDIAKKAKYIKAFLWSSNEMLPYVGAWTIDRQPMQESMKILAIGNSHNENSTKFVYEFAKQLGIDEVIVGYTYSGGATLETLYNNTVLKTAVPYYKKKNGEWQRGTSTITDAVKDEEWDVVFIQEGVEMVGIPAVDTSKYDSTAITAYSEKHLSYLTDMIRAYCPNKEVEIGWHATFAFADADKMSSAFPGCLERLNAWYDGSSDTMFLESAEAVRQKIVSDKRFSRIIWNSTAIQNAGKIPEIAALSTNGNLRVADGIHIDNVGSVVAGLAWIKSLGFSIDKLERIKETVEPSVLSLNADQVLTGEPLDVTFITDEQFELMKSAVNAAYENPYAITELAGSAE